MFTEIEVDDDATPEQIKQAVDRALMNEANELLGGIDFLDDDIKNKEWSEV